MKRLQERKLNMYEVVLDFLNATDPNIISQIPQVDVSITLLETKVNQITDFVGEQITNRKGIAAAKVLHRQTLTDKTIIIARKVEAFAVNNNNTELAAKVKFSNTAIEKMPDNILVATATNIHDIALPIIADLAPYNLVTDNLVDYKTNIDTYFSYLSKPRTEIVEKKDATSELRKLFSETDDLLKNKIDILVGSVHSDEPHFYNNYTNSRILIDPGFRTLAARCLVTDIDNQAITGVKVKILGTRKHYLTKSKGYCYIKSLPEGSYEFSFAKEGYNTKVVSVAVVNNERSEVKIVLNQ